MKERREQATNKALAQLLVAYKDLVSDMHIQYGHSGFSDECSKPECAYYIRIVKRYEQAQAKEKKG